MGCAFASRDGDPSEGYGNGNWKGKGKMSEWDAARRTHLSCMVHRHQCGPEEWRLRLVVAGLRQVHAEGLLKN